MTHRIFATVLACALLAGPTMAADKPSPEACAAVRTGAVSADKAKPPQARPATPETAAALAQLKAAKNGSAAPNAEAQAMLGVLANMTASRGEEQPLPAVVFIGLRGSAS